jgi:A/G-specific adenine glycosylase
MNSTLLRAFREQIIPWYEAHQRDLPWRQTADPYAIWLSEIILQQTRVQQGLPYFVKFIQHFPSIKDLALAHEDEVFNLWQGLGYYSRARNLHKGAQWIVEQHGGQFPSTYEGLLHIPGVGPYTAAAIASFAFQVPKAAVDGNVLRWTSRVFGSDAPIDLPATRNMIQNELDLWIQECPPHTFNQASMEFGALICTPQPKCMLCPIQDHCASLRTGNTRDLPIKSKKTKVEEKQLYALFIQNNKGEMVIEKRPSGGIWGQLYTFPMELVDQVFTTQELQVWAQQKGLPKKLSKQLQNPYLTQHLLTHRRIKVHIFSILLENMPKNASIFERWISVKDAANIGVPKVFETYLKTQFPEYAGLI